MNLPLHYPNKQTNNPLQATKTYPARSSVPPRGAAAVSIKAVIHHAIVVHVFSC